jgi:hypothetical protein
MLSDSTHHASYIIFDNLEFTGLYWSGTCNSSTPNSCSYLSQHGYGGSDVSWEFKNGYLHGWSHNSSPFFDPGNDTSLIWMKQEQSTYNTSIHDTVVSGADTTRDCCGALSAWVEYNNYIEYVDNAEFGEIGLLHDNVVTNMVVTGGNNGVHGNCVHLFGGLTTNEIVYNNYVTCLNTGTPDEMFLVEEDHATLYAFNNVMVKDGHGTGFELGIFNGGPGGTYILFNNSSECGVDSAPGGSCLTGKNGSPTVIASDNFFVTSNAPILKESGSSWSISAPSPTFSVTCSSGVHSNFGGTAICAPLGSSNGTGNLNLTETYPFAPMDSTAAAKVGTGQNNMSYCTAISAINAAAGAACLSDTTVGISYNATKHTVTWPNRTPVPRPTGRASWTNGAYEPGTGTSASVNPPSGLTATVN